MTMKDYTDVWAEAVGAGSLALYDCIPTPIAVYSAGLHGEKLGKEEIIEEGNCGGAYIILHNGRSEFVRWMKVNQGRAISKNYPGSGFTVSISQAHERYHGQSAERYEACADAMVEVLKSHGISCSTRAYLT